MSDKDAMSDDTATGALEGAMSEVNSNLGFYDEMGPHNAAVILAALDRAGWALVKRADVAESLFERDVWNALDAAAPKESGQ